MRDQAAPWSDWREIPLGSAFWPTGPAFTGPWTTPPTASIGADQPDFTADIGVAGATAPRVNLSGVLLPVFGEGVGIGVGGFFYTLPIPDYVIGKQPRRFAEWSGLAGDEYVDGGIAGVMRAIEIENVLSSIANDTSIGQPLLDFSAVVKFRGFGSALSGAQTEDTAILAPTFPGMTVDAPDFQPDGIMRLRTVVQLPNTLAVGDYADLFFQVRVAGNRPAPVVQWWACKYRWVDQPFTVPSNTTLKMDGTGGLLESQSRLDDLPYEP
jgi:hypothetical protein